ncbi:hypothetical protein HMPREF9946_02031 [Acetobacteraceae bacterium AT-5844]|nr:hypothetical protein HMPREF9946_02031 [Acetobacteraceae bacterium AT-5844]
MCTICDLRIEFSVEHPMSLSVAVATRQAIDAGLLPTVKATLSEQMAKPLRVEAIEALKSLQERFEYALDRPGLLDMPDFFALMVESRTWGFFHPTAQGFDPNCRPEPPRVASDDVRERDAVIVGAESALRHILAGKLTGAEAIRSGLLVVDAEETKREKIVSALLMAFPEVGYSRFLCA